MNGELEALSFGQLYRFADWPNEAVPAVAAGAYTVWDGDKLVYAGMAGRSLTADSILERRNDHEGHRASVPAREPRFRSP